jgi:lysophospholipase L1-like esterase
MRVARKTTRETRRPTRHFWVLLAVIVICSGLGLSSSADHLAAFGVLPRTAGAAPDGVSPPWQLVGLGDSIPAAAGCPGCDGFLDLFARRITHDTGRSVAVADLGVGGWTSDDLASSLSDLTTANVISAGDVLTVTIGANDFLPMLDAARASRCGGADGIACFAPALIHLRQTLSSVLQRIRVLRHGQPTDVRVTGYWDVFLDGRVADETYGPDFQILSSALTRQVNDVIESVSREQNVTYVDLYSSFGGRGVQRTTHDCLPWTGTIPAKPDTSGLRTLSLRSVMLRSGTGSDLCGSMTMLM